MGHSVTGKANAAHVLTQLWSPEHLSGQRGQHERCQPPFRGSGLGELPYLLHDYFE